VTLRRQGLVAVAVRPATRIRRSPGGGSAWAGTRPFRAKTTSSRVRIDESSVCDRPVRPPRTREVMRKLKRYEARAADEEM
jgi:hypothetical protein